jgi:hypothetical protein
MTGWDCPCGLKNPAEASSCANCGGARPGHPMPGVGGSDPTTAGRGSSPERKTCPLCQHTSRPDAAFCANCGQAFPRTGPAARRCSVCGNRVVDLSAPCPHCEMVAAAKAARRKSTPPPPIAAPVRQDLILCPAPSHSRTGLLAAGLAVGLVVMLFLAATSIRGGRQEQSAQTQITFESIRARAHEWDFPTYDEKVWLAARSREHYLQEEPGAQIISSSPTSWVGQSPRGQQSYQAPLSHMEADELRARAAGIGPPLTRDEYVLLKTQDMWDELLLNQERQRELRRNPWGSLYQHGN